MRYDTNFYRTTRHLNSTFPDWRSPYHQQLLESPHAISHRIFIQIFPLLFRGVSVNFLAKLNSILFTHRIYARRGTYLPSYRMRVRQVGWYRGIWRCMASVFLDWCWYTRFELKGEAWIFIGCRASEN